MANELENTLELTPEFPLIVEFNYFNVDDQRLAFSYKTEFIHRPQPEPETDVEIQFTRLSTKWVRTAISFFESISVLNTAVYDLMGTRDLTETADSLRAIASQVEENGDIVRLKFTNERVYQVMKKLSFNERYSDSASIMNRAALTALLAEYEAYLIEFLLIASQDVPDKILPKDAMISLSELKSYSSINEAINARKTKAIEDLMRESHFEALKSIYNKFGLTENFSDQIFIDFREICARRNIIVHNGAKVNQRYIDDCLHAGLKENWLPKIGDNVEIDPEYLRRATARIFYVGFYTLHMYWQKQGGNSIQRSIGNILGSAHSFLEQDLTKVCDKLCHFVLDKKKSTLTQESKINFTINLAQSKLFDPDEKIPDAERLENVEMVLAECDWSIVDAKTRLALVCLRRDRSNLSALTLAAKQEGLTQDAAFTWSIFREVRELEEFYKHFS